MFHSFISSQTDQGDEQLDCIRCGATYFHSDYGLCSGRTDLVHGVDVSSHILDACPTFERTGDCAHLAARSGCDCSLCEAPAPAFYTADRVQIRSGLVVWSNDLKRVIVGEPDKWDAGWFMTRTPEGGNGPLLNGERMITRHPSTGELA